MRPTLPFAAAHASLDACLEGQCVWVRDTGLGASSRGTLVALARDALGRRAVRSLDLYDVHKAFFASEAPAEQHPLIPVLRAWYYERSTPSSPFRPRTRASFPRLHQIATGHEAAGYLSSDPRTAGSGPTLPLGSASDPDVEVVDSCHSWLLQLFASCRQTRSSRCLPWAFRLVVAALVNLPIDDRDGRPHDLQMTLDEVVDLLALKSQGRWSNKHRDFPRLIDALNETQRYRIRIGRRLRTLVSAEDVPGDYEDDAPCALRVVVPPGPRSGMRFDWWRFRREASQSSVRARAHLSLTALLDRSARRGQPITRLVRPALTSSKTGLPVRAPGGRIVRAQALVPNPRASLAPYLPKEHAAAFVGLASTDKNKSDALDAIESFAVGPDAVIDLVEERGGYRVYGVSPRLS